MPKEGFKDRIYNVEQETSEEREERGAKKAVQARIDGLRSAYGKEGRAYGSWIPGTREKIDSATF